MIERAPVTTAIAVVTGLAGAALLLTGQVDDAAIYAGFIPVRFGAGLPLFGDASLVPAVLTPFSATMVHGNIVHLLFNLVMLVFAGRATEKALGSRGLLVLYAVGAIASVFAHWLVDPASVVPMIGASGAVSGVVGAYSLLYGRNRAKPIGPFSAQAVHVAWLVVAWTIINILVGLMSAGSGMPVAAAAHIGGFIAGVALTRSLLKWHWRNA